MKDVILRCPGKNEIRELQALWSAIFGSVGMDAFFNILFDRELCVAAFNNKELCAMGYIVPTEGLVCREKIHGCAMIYSVATAPDHRGKGYAKAVVKQLAVKAHTLGYPIATLSPSDETLFEFYEKNCGFTDHFYTEEKLYTKTQLRSLPNANTSPQKVSAETYAQMREDLLGQHTYIRQGSSILEYQRMICDEVGGGLYRIGDSCAVIEVSDDSAIFVKELLSRSDNHDEIIAAIAEVYPSHKYIVRTPATSKNSKRFGMVKIEKRNSEDIMPAEPLSYYGLALD